MARALFHRPGEAEQLDVAQLTGVTNLAHERLADGQRARLVEDGRVDAR